MTGSVQISELTAGTYTYTINCAGIQASTQVTFTGSLTALTASASSAIVNTPITLSWNSPPSTTSCTASGGSTGDGWTGSLASTGTKMVTSPAASTIAYSISCTLGSGASQAMTQVTYTPVTATEPATPTPALTLTSSASTQVVGTPVTLSWTSQYASACSASGGASGDGWSGNLPLSGSMSITESIADSVSYGINCTGAPPAASATISVDFTAASVTITSNSGGGKSGGGGAFDAWWVSLLGLSMCWQIRRRLSEARGGS